MLLTPSVRGQAILSLHSETLSIRHYASNIDQQVHATHPCIVSAIQIILLWRAIHTMLYTQVNKKTFRCTFYEIPEAEYQPGGLPDKAFQLDDDDVRLYHGTLTIDFTPELMEKGSFKTAHPGEVQLDGSVQTARQTVLSDRSPFPNGVVCVKQVYERRENSNAIARVRGRHELSAFSVECNCLKWASILLDLTYQFITREIKTRGEPSRPIPALRFTRTMIAIVQDPSAEKAFLVEEWINTDKGERPYIKYLNNRYPQSCVSHSAPPKAHEIAEFLTFAQHVQWEKTHFLAFTSDYQGSGELLTDPQITSDPYVSSFLCFRFILPVFCGIFYQRCSQQFIQ